MAQKRGWSKMDAARLDRRRLAGLLIGSATAASLPFRGGNATEPLRILTTTGMVGDLARGVAGNGAEVTQLMGAGVDPHLYKPTRSDVARLLGADIVFYNGLLLEGKMTDALVRVATSGKPVFAVTELIDESYLRSPPEFQGHHDPHVWMDPRAWAKAVEVVRDRLSAHDPARADADRTLAALA